MRTDKKGHFGHYGLPPDSYSVAVYLNGRIVEEAENVPLAPGQPYQLDFDLTGHIHQP